MDLLKNASRAVQEAIELRTMLRAFPDLYTTSISEHRCRLNLRRLDSKSSRNGEIIEVERNNSLFGIMHSRYNEAFIASLPDLAL